MRYIGNCPVKIKAMPKDNGLNRKHAITLVLAVLGEGSRHGYDIAREVERRSGSEISLHDGSFYPVLRQLEGEGWIVSEWEGEEGTRRKRIYTLTPAGHGELAKQVEAWRSFSGAMERVLTGEKSQFNALCMAWQWLCHCSAGLSYSNRKATAKPLRRHCKAH
jgi:PadR family transcriptional regulator PadR